MINQRVNTQSAPHSRRLAHHMLSAHREVFVVGARDHFHTLCELDRRHVTHDFAHLHLIT